MRRNESLRRKQFQVAMNGNAAMLIWLGKQFLGQTDRREELLAAVMREQESTVHVPRGLRRFAQEVHELSVADRQLLRSATDKVLALVRMTADNPET